MGITHSFSVANIAALIYFQQNIINMKKKKLNLEAKLFLQKFVVYSLNDVNQASVLGGATLQGDTTPCGACPASLDTGCQSKQWSQCATVDNGQGVCCRGLITLAC